VPRLADLELALEILVVGDVPVVRHDDAVGVVDHERLGIPPHPSRPSVAHVADPDPALQPLDVVGEEDVADESLPFFTWKRPS